MATSSGRTIDRIFLISSAFASVYALLLTAHTISLRVGQPTLTWKLPDVIVFVSGLLMIVGGPCLSYAAMRGALDAENAVVIKGAQPAELVAKQERGRLTCHVTALFMILLGGMLQGLLYPYIPGLEAL